MQMHQRNDKLILNEYVQRNKFLRNNISPVKLPRLSNSVKHKPRLRADGSTLLPSALRPGLFVLFGILGIFLFQNSYVSNVSAASMTLTLPTVISVNVEPNGSFVKSSTSSFSAKTDGAWGYNLSIKAKTTADMTNGSAKLTAIPKSMTEAEYTAAGNNNTWGYVPSILNNQSNTNFIAATTSATQIDKTSSANASAAKSYSITLGAKADSAAIQGIYSNTMVLTLSANPKAYSIAYDCVSGSSCPSTQSGSTTNANITLSSTVPTKSGYEFQGWCSTSPTNNNSSSVSCSGTTYQKGASYPLSKGASVTLYAMWESNQPITMQDFGNYCNSMSQNQSLTLKDTRDGTSYTVAKLKDNKCWMTKNLQIVNKTLYSSDSDVASSFRLPASSTNSPSSYDELFIYIDSTYGGYYNWFTATVGEGTQSKTVGETSHSICPKGWRLPTFDEFSALTKSYGGSSNATTNLQKEPANFKMGGCRMGNSLQELEAGGFYWSSTPNQYVDTAAFHLTIGVANQCTGLGCKSYGQSVRCVNR